MLNFVYNCQSRQFFCNQTVIFTVKKCNFLHLLRSVDIEYLQSVPECLADCHTEEDTSIPELLILRVLYAAGVIEAVEESRQINGVLGDLRGIIALCSHVDLSRERSKMADELDLAGIVKEIKIGSLGYLNALLTEVPQQAANSCVGVLNVVNGVL